MPLIIVLEKYRQEIRIPVYPELHTSQVQGKPDLHETPQQTSTSKRERKDERNRERETQR